MEEELDFGKLDPDAIAKARLLSMGLAGLFSILLAIFAWRVLKKGFWGTVLFAFFGSIMGNAIAAIINSTRNYVKK
jgi:hypothetical protein